jgi:hypothetical protein
MWMGDFQHWQPTTLSNQGRKLQPWPASIARIQGLGNSFTTTIFVVVPRPKDTARYTKCRAKIHSHSTKNKREFTRRVNILENSSGNLAQFFFL